MSPLWPLCFVPLLVLRTVELRHVHTEGERMLEDAGSPVAGSEESTERSGQSALYRAADLTGTGLKRVVRGAKDGGFKRREPLPPRRHDDPSGYFTTPRTGRSTAALPGNSSGRPVPGARSPLLPVTEGSLWAYAVMLLALVLFAAGIVGNLALMCIVWHNFYLKSAWNCILAGLALWDFLVLFFCLPVVVFHELTSMRLLGELSCRLVPYLEVTSLGVATFSLCALSIDRFHAATGPGPQQMPKVEPCQSILSKLSVIWVGSLVLAAPELLLYHLMRQSVPLPVAPGERGLPSAAFRGRADSLVVDVCVAEPSLDLPESVLSLVMTYHEARTWWMFGCYLCLPLLFTLACDLVTRQVLTQRTLQKPAGDKLSSRSSSSSASSSANKKKQHSREQRLRSAVMALTILYVTCNLPESICNIALAYISVPVSDSFPAVALPALTLIGQFLLFVRCSATPLLLLCVCRSLGQAFMDCCCCCCEECLPDGNSSSASSASTAIAATTPLPSPTSLSPLTSPISLSPLTSPSHASPPKEETMKSVSTGADTPIGTPC